MQRGGNTVKEEGHKEEGQKEGQVTKEKVTNRLAGNTGYRPPKMLPYFGVINSKMIEMTQVAIKWHIYSLNC